MLKLLRLLIISGLLLLPLFGGISNTLSNSPDYGSFDKYQLATDNPFKRGPTVNLVTNNSALIFWRTAEPTNATVQYGLTTDV